MPSDGNESVPSEPRTKEHPDLRERLPQRRTPGHDTPSWVSSEATFFITVNCVPRGVNHLADDKRAALLSRTIAYRMRSRQWWPELVLFMPDHVHGLISFPSENRMDRVVRNWKRYASTNLSIPWQRDFFDHRIRNDESLCDRWNYILMNPVRAKLVATPEEWPYVWTARTLQDLW